MTYTDEQLKRTLAKMLPETVREDYGTEGDDFHLEWKIGRKCMRVLDTELLHLCWLVERQLKAEHWRDYVEYLITTVDGGPPKENMFFIYTATWQQRTTALAKTKGIEIV